jgi:hypothetical protein
MQSKYIGSLYFFFQYSIPEEKNSILYFRGYSLIHHVSGSFRIGSQQTQKQPPVQRITCLFQLR